MSEARVVRGADMLLDEGDECVPTLRHDVVPSPPPLRRSRGMYATLHTSSSSDEDEENEDAERMPENWDPTHPVGRTIIVPDISTVQVNAAVYNERNTDFDGDDNKQND